MRTVFPMLFLALTFAWCFRRSFTVSTLSLYTANIKAVQPLLFLALISAPYNKRNSATSNWPLIAAYIKPVRPYSFLALTFAPLLNACSTSSARPHSHSLRNSSSSTLSDSASGFEPLSSSLSPPGVSNKLNSKMKFCVTLCSDENFSSSPSSIRTISLWPSCIATFKAVPPLTVLASVSAPCLRRTLTNSGWPLYAACINAVAPLSFLALTFAPYLRRSSAMSVLPEIAAAIKAVLPSFVLALTFAPFSRRSSTISALP